MTDTWRFEDVDLAGLERIAGALALVVRPGDMIALEGDLGAGKTTFARALIGHLRNGLGEEIPSPTFALVQTYDAPRMAVTHVDAYRLDGGGDADELGLDDALGQGLLLIEWPERIAERLLPDRLDVALDESTDESRRTLKLKPHGGWSARLARLRLTMAFIERAGWDGARLHYLQGDASARRYTRLARDGSHAVLMDAPRQPDGPPIRDGKPYSALAHLAEDVRPFVAVSFALRDLGLSAPTVMAQDISRGFLLLEDLGDRVFTREAAQGTPLAALYRPAVDVLLHLRAGPPPPALKLPEGDPYRLPPYDTTALSIETELLLDWFWPALHGAPAPQDARAAFVSLWRERFDWLAARPSGWVLRDYHSPNLMWLPEREDMARVGILDIQDALLGPPAYDLVSLLQDARLDVPAALERDLLDYYCARCGERESTFDSAEFRAAYATLGAQRNTKILGIFARLAKRDGKRAYLAHIPRVAAYLARNLAHPALAPLRAWYDRHLPPEIRSRPLAV